jgi:hypothetical protein
MESKDRENVQIVSLSEEDRESISSVLRRNIANAIPEDEGVERAQARVVGIYVDPPGVCIAVD